MLLPQVAPVGSSWARAVGITHVVAPHFGAGRVDLLGSSILTNKVNPHMNVVFQTLNEDFFFMS